LIEKVEIVVAGAAGVALMKMVRKCRRARQSVVYIVETAPALGLKLWEDMEKAPRPSFGELDYLNGAEKLRGLRAIRAQ